MKQNKRSQVIFNIPESWRAKMTSYVPLCKTPFRTLLMLSASHTPSNPTELKVPRYPVFNSETFSNAMHWWKMVSYLSLVQELEDNCSICVRPYYHSTSWDSGQVAGSPLSHISRATVAAQKLEVLGTKILGPRRKSSSWNQTENVYGTDVGQDWYLWLQVCSKHRMHTALLSIFEIFLTTT